MNEQQYKFGKGRLKIIADEWGVSELVAARILYSKAYNEFWQWVRTDEFLNVYLFNASGQEMR